MQSILKTYRGLNKSIYYIFVAEIINSTGAFVFPFLTLFLTEKLGLSAFEAGSYLTLTLIIQVPGMFLGARLADTIGRKKLYLLSATLMASMLIPPAFMGSSKNIIYFILLMSAFSGAVQPTFNAMVSDLARGEERKKAFSLLYLGWNAGYALGPMLAGLLFNNYLPLIFLGDAATTIIAIILIYLKVPETKKTQVLGEEEELPELEKAASGSTFSLLLKRPIIILVSFLLIFYRLVYAQSIFSLPLQLNSIFGQQGPALYGINASFNALVVIIFTIFITGITFKLKPLLNICIAGILLGCGFGMIYLINTFYLFLLSTFFWTLGEILEATNINVYISNHAPINHRARFHSLFTFISGIGFAVAPKLAGIFTAYYPLEIIWLLSFWIMILTSAILYVICRLNRT